MFRNFPMKPHRNQAINLHCKPIECFLNDMILQQKVLLNSTEYKNEILYKTQE